MALYITSLYTLQSYVVQSGITSYYLRYMLSFNAYSWAFHSLAVWTASMATSPYAAYTCRINYDIIDSCGSLSDEYAVQISTWHYLIDCILCCCHMWRYRGITSYYLIYMLNFNESSWAFQTLAVWTVCYIIILIMVDRMIWNSGMNFNACYLSIDINQLNK